MAIMEDNNSGEQSTLLGNDRVLADDFNSVDEIMKHFWLMTVPYTMLWSSYFTLFAYSSSVFSVSVASYGSGFANVTYMLTSLFGAAYLVNEYGARFGLIVSGLFFVLFAICMIIAGYVEDENTTLFFVITGSSLSGLALSTSSVAQGVFFGTYSDQLSRKNQTPVSETNSVLASYSATMRMASQVVYFLFASIMQEFTSITQIELFIIYGGTSFLCLLGMYFTLPYLRVEFDESFKEWNSILTDRIFPVLIMVSTDVVSMCIAPIIITFEFEFTFLFVIVNDKVAASKFSSYIIGYLNVLYAATSAIVAIPMAYYISKVMSIGVGSLTYVLFALAFLLFSYSQLGVSKYIWMLYVLYGIGRTSYESTARAIYADLYPDQLAIGFAHLNFVGGLASTIISFAQPSMTSTGLGIMILVPACCMLPGYLMALKLREKETMKK